MLFKPQPEILKRNGYYVKNKIREILKNPLWFDIIGPKVISKYELFLLQNVYYQNIDTSTFNGLFRKRLRE